MGWSTPARPPHATQHGSGLTDKDSSLQLKGKQVMVGLKFLLADSVKGKYLKIPTCA